MKHLLEDLYSFGARRPGTPKGHRAEEYIKKKFQGLHHLSTYTQKIPIQSWQPQEYSLHMAAEKLECFYIPYTAWTEKTSAKTVWWSDVHKRNPDCRGKIVIVEFEFPELLGWQLKMLAFDVFDPEKNIPFGKIHPATWIRKSWYLYHEAAKRGAVGFIGVLKNQPGDLASYYAPYGFREGKNILNKPIPGLWVGRKTGEILRSNPDSQLDIKLQGKTEDSYTQNILGVYPGKSDRTIFIGCHHDSPFSNAVEDASGMAVVMDLASKAFIHWSNLEHTIVFAATAGHFYGSIGTRTLIERNEKNHIRNASCSIWIEHIGKEVIEQSGKLVLTGRAEPSAFFTNYNKDLVRIVKKAIRKHKIVRSLILPAAGPLGDYPPTDGGDFYKANVPVINMIANPVYLLVDSDSLDMIDFERMERTRDAVISMVKSIDKSNQSDLMDKDYPIRRHLGNMMAKNYLKKVKSVQ